MTETLVVAENVSKAYRKGKEPVEVLHDLNMNIPEGDFVALMGPSGSGKTTLLNILGGLDRPSGGAVTVGDTDLTAMSNSRLAAWRARHIGFIFQFYNLLPVLTAARNVELPLLLTHLSKSKRREHVDTALSVVGLSDRATHYPRELSGGQEQRVAIARALVSDPTLLLCDEPTGDLDRETADDILTLLRTLNDDHRKTIVMVTHDPQAADYAKRTLYLDKGTLSNGAGS